MNPNLEKLMKQWILALALTAMGTASLASTPGGTAGFQFLKTHTSARSAGMAGAMVAVSPDPGAIHYNPAIIAFTGSRSGSFSYLHHLLDFNAGHIVYLQPRTGPGTAAAAIDYMDYGDFDKRDQDNQDLGQFHAGSIAFTGGYGLQPLPHLAVGLAIKYVRAAIDDYASDAVAFDGGLIYRIPSQQLAIGASFANAGKVLSAYIIRKDPLPAVFRFGLSKGLAHLPLVLSLQLYKYSDEEWHGALGGEFTVYENVFLRLGYDQSGRELHVDQSNDRFAGAALGLGTVWRDYRIDYAISSMGALGVLNRFTLSGSF
ncbi:MAG TPA: PorV/PorQ family protein [bacterium]|nr:PorV/PorQ family protein [bacterium]HQG44497.1 PorV/PorQ family protein [bacterium]HQI47792.1 PorV/PorQ family protein [bacterium]HQJ65415.1 PorV/PorQ family protein [bacterium]